ncbi:MAG: formate dehydrogenase subunit alpha [Blastocatellales bacterium]
MARVRINKQEYSFDGSFTILEALKDAGIEVPTLCHDDRLEPCGDCRMCLVEIAGRNSPATSCTTRLEDGMEIETHTPALESERRALLAMMADRYPAEQVERFPGKPFHGYLRDYGLEGACAGVTDPAKIDDSHPYIRVDMSRCIDCYRCIRICREVQGQFVWHMQGRGSTIRIAPDSMDGLLDSTCVSCGACVDTCPTGALEDVMIARHGEPEAWTRTTCPYCGTGCEMEVGVRAGRMISVRPYLEAPVNRGHLCVKGRYAFNFVYARDRVTAPMIRRDGTWREVGWDEALEFTASELRRMIESHGPDSVGMLGSSRATNEENYLTQKFARVVLGTNNVDCCARVCHAPTAAAMKAVLGTGAATNSYDDIELASTIMVCGSNTTENHPVIGARIRQAALKGARLIVIDPRRIELADIADVHLQLRPGTNVALFNSLAAAIVDEGLCDQSFLEDRVIDHEEFFAFIREFLPEKIGPLCGVEPELIRRAARLYATAKPAMCIHGLGMTEHTQGTEGVMALSNLSLLTGNIGIPGGGVNPMRGQNNVQGSAHMGCEPAHLTGYVGLDAGRQAFESVWKSPLPSTRGLNMMEMMDAMRDGRVKALWTIGYDILLTNANASSTRQALDNLELVIIQDLFMNETAREYGTVFLPVASSFEKDGTFMNAERRIQMVRRVIDPPGEAKSDWEVIRDVARAMGYGDQFDFGSAGEIWDEVRALWPAGRGISYERLRERGIQWPCPDESHPGTRILHVESFPHGRKTNLRTIPYRPTPETISDRYPLLLITGRTLHQFNAGTMTMRTRNRNLRETDYLDISPMDAERLSVSDGEFVRLSSHYGEAVIPVEVNDAVRPGELFTTFHTAEVFLNNVTSPLRDALTEAPEYKVTAVRVDKID